MNKIFEIYKFVKDLIKNVAFSQEENQVILSRIKFGFLIIIPTYFAIYIGEYIYCIYVMTVAIIILLEFLKIIENIKEKNINFYFFYKKYGIFYILIATICLILVRFTKQGFQLTFWLFTITWIFDVFCYVFGKKYGRIKLSSISPGKTVEGFILGSLTSIIFSFILLKMFRTENGLNYDTFLFLNIAFVICIQYADILESYIKRICEVKDSGTLLGGHGGFMDRFDGIYGGAILIYLFNFFASGKIF